eukprot:scaffold426_cov319-Pavlova_lutheri.AAC.17
MHSPWCWWCKGFNQESHPVELRFFTFGNLDECLFYVHERTIVHSCLSRYFQDDFPFVDGPGLSSPFVNSVPYFSTCVSGTKRAWNTYFVQTHDYLPSFDTTLHSSTRVHTHRVYTPSTDNAIGCIKQPLASPALLCTQTTQRVHQSIRLPASPSGNPHSLLSLTSNDHADDVLQPPLHYNTAQLGWPDQQSHAPPKIQSNVRGAIDKLAFGGTTPRRALAAACLRLFQTCFIAKPSPPCTTVVLNSSTGTVLKHKTHSLNARDVRIASSPWPPGANLVAT